MSRYTYTLNQLSALGVSDLQLHYASLDADTATLRIPMAVATSPAVPWSTGDRIIITDDRAAGAPRIFNGRVRKLRTELNGTSYHQTAELANDVDVLNATTFAHIGDNGFAYAQSFYLPREDGESQQGERLTSSQYVCEACYTWARAGGAMDSSYSVNFDATIMGIAGTGSQSCWSLILSAMRWVPDACTAMRYSASGDRFYFLTSRDLAASTINVSRGTITAAGESAPHCTFEQVESVTLTPRPDLIPPCCALTGRITACLPEGGDIRSPGAFIYHVRPRTTGGGVLPSEVKTAAMDALVEQAPKQCVRGIELPINLALALGEVNMREASNLPPGKLLNWWRREGNFPILGAATTDSVFEFGNPVFAPVAAEDAYPADEESEEEDSSTAGPPANYQTPETWGKIYLHKEGPFPAAPDIRHCLKNGFRWCRGTLRQLVWLKDSYTSLPADEQARLLVFCAGSCPITEGGTTTIRRYAELTLSGTYINRRKVTYREGSNEEVDPDSTTGEPDTPLPTPGGGSGPDPDYEAALQTFYAATRKLYYDGSITLTGITGNPSKLLSTGINITDLLPEWASMSTPCNTIDYDPLTRRATLTLGSRESLHMDELVERQRLGLEAATCRSNGATTNPLDTTPDELPEDTASPGDGEAAVELIAPNITASQTATSKGRMLGPFEVYADNGKWYLNGGTLPEGTKVDTTDITAHYAPGRKYYYRIHPQTGQPLLRYRDTTTS